MMISSYTVSAGHDQVRVIPSLVKGGDVTDVSGHGPSIRRFSVSSRELSTTVTKGCGRSKGPNVHSHESSLERSVKPKGAKNVPTQVPLNAEGNSWERAIVWRRAKVVSVRGVEVREVRGVTADEG